MRASDNPRDRAAIEAEECITPRMETQMRDSDRSIGQLLKDLRDETQLLLRQEVALAKTEMTEKFIKLARNAAYMVIGGVILYTAALFLLIAAACGVVVGLRAADIEPNVYSWLAPLIVAAVVGILGVVLVMKAINAFRHESMMPEKTMASIQENKEWIEHKMK